MDEKIIWKIVKIIAKEFSRELAKGNFNGDHGYEETFEDWQYGDFIIDFRVKEIFNCKNLQRKPFKRKGKVL